MHNIAIQTFKRLPLFAALLTLLASILSTLPASAETYLSAKDEQLMHALKAEALASELSYELLESLTTEVGARLAGTASDPLAVAWAVAKMEALGFDKVWTEPVEVPIWERGELSVNVTAPYPQRLEALSLGGSVGTARKGLNAEVVEFPSLAALDAVAEGSLNGKIAYISNRMIRHVEGRGYGPAVAARGRGASAAAKKGAIAFLLRSIGTDDNRTPHTGGMNYEEGVAKIPAIALSNPDADLLSNMLRRGTTSVRIKSSAKSHSKKTFTTHNVIGEITGSEAPDEIVALGAHLDSWDVGTGAMDDGLGVAMTIAAAAMIGKQTPAPKRTIRVILYAAEEIGFFGTIQYMKDHENEVAKHVIGAEWDFGLGRIYELRPGVGEVSLAAAKALATHLGDLGVLLGKGNDAQAQSDMSLLSKAGMPAINFAPDGSRYFDLHHTDNDTLDKIDPEDLKQNTSVYTVFAWFASQSGVDFRK